LYRIHLKDAQDWGSTWHVILDSIHESTNQELEKKYKTIEEKLKKTCTHPDKKKPDYKGNFYPQVINQTDITITNDELTLLNRCQVFNVDYQYMLCY
jgi:hypothetical protein